MKAEIREQLRFIQGVLDTFRGIHYGDTGLINILISAADTIEDILEDEGTTESEEEQCKE